MRDSNDNPNLHIPDSIGYVVDNHVYVNQPDYLDLLIEANRLDTATALAVHGPVSGEDLRYLRLLCGGDYGEEELIEEKADTTLKSIDLSEAWFVSSPKECYAIYIHHISSLVLMKNYIKAMDKFPNLAFYLCPTLRTIKLPTTTKMVGYGALSNTSIDSLTIPEGVENVVSALCDCANLKYVSLPASIQNLYSPFDGDRQISEIVCHSETPPSLDIGVWEDSEEEDVDEALPFHSTCLLRVPKGCAEKYKTTDGWKYFEHIVEME